MTTAAPQLPWLRSILQKGIAIRSKITSGGLAANVGTDIELLATCPAHGEHPLAFHKLLGHFTYSHNRGQFITPVISASTHTPHLDAGFAIEVYSCATSDELEARLQSIACEWPQCWLLEQEMIQVGINGELLEPGNSDSLKTILNSVALCERIRAKINHVSRFGIEVQPTTPSGVALSASDYNHLMALALERFRHAFQKQCEAQGWHNSYF